MYSPNILNPEQLFDFGYEPVVTPKKVYLFADERKKIHDRWDYHCIVLIEEEKLLPFYERLMAARDEVKFFSELKFAELHATARYEKYTLAQKWISIFLETQATISSGIYFTISGIDREKIDFSFFGDDDTPKGKYANLYNRFFRASAKGMIHYCYRNEKIIIKQIYHDCEGNLQNHAYFEECTIKKIAEETHDIGYENKNIIFVNSDHQKEETYTMQSQIIQFVDILIGASTYCLHITNKKNKGQLKTAELLFPLLRERLKSVPQNKRTYPGSIKSTISIFPRDRCYEHNLDIRESDYCVPSCQAFENLLDKQIGLQELFDPS